MDNESQRSADEREPNTGLHPDALIKISEMFGRNLSVVLRAHTHVEAVSGETNLIGRQNLIEAFTHLATLLARARVLDRDQQLEQVVHFSDHLRRVMMESFEVEVNVVIAGIWNDGGDQSIGRQYDSRAAPLIRRKKLLGHIRPDEVETRLDEIPEEVVVARSAKIADGDFSEWEQAANALKQAAQKARALEKEVGAAVDAANARRTTRIYMLVGALLSAAIGVGLTLLVQAL